MRALGRRRQVRVDPPLPATGLRLRLQQAREALDGNDVQLVVGLGSALGAAWLLSRVVFLIIVMVIGLLLAVLAVLRSNT